MKRWSIGVLAVVAALVVAVALVGCAGSGFDQVSFGVEGGFAGFDTRLDIARDGTWTVTERGNETGSGVLDASKVKELAKLAAAVDWKNRAAEYLPSPPIPDDMTYRIGVDGHYVAISSVAGDAPDDVDALALYLGNLLAELRAGK